MRIKFFFRSTESWIQFIQMRKGFNMNKKKMKLISFQLLCFSHDTVCVCTTHIFAISTSIFEYTQYIFFAQTLLAHRQRHDERVNIEGVRCMMAANYIRMTMILLKYSVFILLPSWWWYNSSQEHLFIFMLTSSSSDRHEKCIAPSSTCHNSFYCSVSVYLRLKDRQESGEKWRGW
jgi:hypothetical protein